MHFTLFIEILFKEAAGKLNIPLHIEAADDPTLAS